MKTKSIATRMVASLMSVLMCVLLMFTLSACEEAPADSDSTLSQHNSVVTTAPDEYASVWEDAVYTKNITIGEGKNSFYLEVKAEDRSITFLVNTDKTVVGDALLENNIIAGDEGPYGLYVKYVNGMLADYDVNSAYWAFYKDGELMSTGVDMTDIESGAHYEMVYTK